MTTMKKLKFSGLATLPLPEPKVAHHGSEAVDPEELLQFLLPSGFFHSKSTARLYIFAEFGPVLVKVREGWMSLRSGYKGQHVVTEQELEDMIVDMIREDILKVYVGDAVLKPTEQEEVISQADDKLKSIPNYTKEEIEELLAPALNRDLQYDFHKLQHIVRRERQVQLKERKKMYPDVVGPRLPKKAFKYYEEGLQQSIRPKKFRDSEIFMYTSKALSKNSFRVAEQEDKNNPALVVNSRFLREDPPFNPAIPMLKVPVIKGKGSYVKPHQPWKSQFFPPSELRLGQPRRR
mmetsp:Transcript_52132/g.122307  ORF Transcript_52132/g.122307 Transcript_52132/m.122307 type:complete len:292 (+) Transcript_52132:184-1059(+)